MKEAREIKDSDEWEVVSVVGLRPNRTYTLQIHTENNYGASLEATHAEFHTGKYCIISMV